ncbi:hypothetical protein AB1K54_12370 [Microbacterium sp. BWT-B31]|uniref:DUF6993 domain-containing protein n=1 Tax=Microbacterium sp. BWT-B31 TaxID=3232072 RepID=UPI003529BE57
MTRLVARSRPRGAVRTRSAALAAALLIASTAVLSACAAPAPAPTRSASASASPSASPTTAPATEAPALVPDGTASDNLPFFTQVVQSVWATPDQVSGRAYIDALVAAGFDKSAMQVTQDDSTVGNAAESILFSVQWGQECLVGQVGPATGEPVAVVLPALAEGGCLIGTTRAIDW